jgi:hypothetical protein
VSAIRFDPELFEGGQRPIIHPDRTIGDAVEVVPGSAPGQAGPLKEILRTRGGDDSAQLLTVTIVGAGVYGSTLASSGTAPRGPIVAVVEWGVRGAKSRVEVDVPMGGATFSLVASYITVAARYDGMLLVDGAQLDPEATGAPNPGPRQRVGAMVGYGAYGASARLTRTVRVDSVRGRDVDGGPGRSERVRVPNFARRLLVGGANVGSLTFGINLGTFGAVPVDVAPVSADGRGTAAVDLPGDASFVELTNPGTQQLLRPVLVFDIGL